MHPLSDIMVVGVCPNDDQNSTRTSAESMEAYFQSLVTAVNGAQIIGLLINTVVNSAASAQMIPVNEVEPIPPANMRLYYQLMVKTANGEMIYWCVGLWENAVVSRGLEVATRDHMKELSPTFDYLNYQPTYEGIQSALNNVYADAYKID